MCIFGIEDIPIEIYNKFWNLLETDESIYEYGCSLNSWNALYQNWYCYDDWKQQIVKYFFLCNL